MFFLLLNKTDICEPVCRCFPASLAFIKLHNLLSSLFEGQLLNNFVSAVDCDEQQIDLIVMYNLRPQGGPGSKNKFSSYDRSRGDLENVEDRIKKYCS